MTATNTNLPQFPEAPSWLDVDAVMPPEQQHAVRDAYERLAAVVPVLDNAGRVLREAWDRGNPTDMADDVRETLSASTGVTPLADLIMFAARLLDGGLTLFLDGGEADYDDPRHKQFQSLLDTDERPAS